MSSEFVLEETPIDGLVLIRRPVFFDYRGSLQRLFAQDWSQGEKFSIPVAQINVIKILEKGTVKGMHLQTAPYAERKLVSCISGSVFDVAVDLRIGSRTFGHWFGVTLEADDGLSVLLPEGVAHGVQSLREYSVMHYVHSETYAASHESGLNPFDQEVAIAWPSPVTKVSERDLNLPLVAQILSRGKI